MRQARKDWQEHHYAKAIGGFIGREWPIIAWLASFALIAIGLMQVSRLAEDVDDFSRNLQTNLVNSCRSAGDPVRRALIDVYRDEIEQAQTVDYSSFFPNIPRDELERLIQEGINRDQGVVNRLEAIPGCRARFDSE